MGTRTRRTAMTIPSQYGNLNRDSPARPLNRVTTIPGYSFSNKAWTTAGWHPAQPQPQPMSPEVANLLQNLKCSSKNTATLSTENNSTRANTVEAEDVPIITLDEDESVPTEERQNVDTSSVTNPVEMESCSKENNQTNNSCGKAYLYTCIN